MTLATLPLPYGDIREKKASEIIETSNEVRTTMLVYIGGEYIEIDRDQAWFWTPEWQDRHAQAIIELERGDYLEFEDGEGFADSLLELFNDE